MITENNNNQSENDGDGSFETDKKKHKELMKQLSVFSATKHISPMQVFFLRGGGAHIVKMEEKKEKHGSSS